MQRYNQHPLLKKAVGLETLLVFGDCGGSAAAIVSAKRVVMGGRLSVGEDAVHAPLLG